jgi:hypothetical protein
MYAFFERSGARYETFRSEFGRPAIAERIDSFWRAARRLTVIALGELADDRRLAAVDGAGDRSAQASTTVDLRWSREVRPPGLKESGRSRFRSRSARVW